MSQTKTKSTEMQYSPKPIEAYTKVSHNVKLGPAESAMLKTTAAWNLAYLSHDYAKSLLHIDPNFTVYVHKTTRTMLDGSGQDIGGTQPARLTVASLLHLPAPQFVHKIKSHPVLKSLPLFLAFGTAWLDTIHERSFLCETDGYEHKAADDLTLARAVLSKFISPT